MNLPPLPESLRNLAAEGEEQAFLSEARAWGESCARMAREEAAKLVEGMWEIDGDHTARLFAAAIRKG